MSAQPAKKVAKSRHPFLSRVVSGYRSLAIILLNSLVVLLLLNGVLAAVFAVKDFFAQDPVSEKHSSVTILSLYPDLTEAEVDALLKETWSRPYVYEPFVQFSERSFSGTYVNVHSAGFRSGSAQGPWPPSSSSLTIFVFGGSTTFGYGVADDETFPSQLQKVLTAQFGRTVHVYNFGRGDYYSTQERILYEQLLARGNVPDLAVFVDGINDFQYFQNEPAWSDWFREAVASRSKRPRTPGFLERSSVGRAVKEVRAALGLNQEPSPAGQPGPVDAIENTAQVYAANKTLIEAVSGEFGVSVFFVWQPFPGYDHDHQYYPFSLDEYPQFDLHPAAYERMAELHEAGVFGSNFLWTADLQAERREPLYVDAIHYSARLNRLLAEVVGPFLLERLAPEDLTP